MDFNLINNNWLKYIKSFINKFNMYFDDEYGMLFIIIN